MSGRRPVEGNEDDVSEFGARRELVIFQNKELTTVGRVGRNLLVKLTPLVRLQQRKYPLKGRWVKFHRGEVDRPFAGLLQEKEGEPAGKSHNTVFRSRLSSFDRETRRSNAGWPGPARAHAGFFLKMRPKARAARPVAQAWLGLLLINDTGIAVANICRACKEDAVSQCTVRRWFNRFESGDTSLENREPSERPSTVDDDEFRRCIKEKPEVNIRELTTTLGRTKFTIHNRLNSPGYHKVLPCWIPTV
ncbi:unnamed protein product [Caenorhabditis auriculariae]|uniref:Mos1 transposase HTH domain-containing protein n=1 Tax=Caenorhabditis auriculariae TaxID=2777116 RepID=A0A8S1I0M9_9PELO|nr:unnamed protein product [Caenorhabditis auriculariae]